MVLINLYHPNARPWMKRRPCLRVISYFAKTGSLRQAYNLEWNLAHLSIAGSIFANCSLCDILIPSSFNSHRRRRKQDYKKLNLLSLELVPHLWSCVIGEHDGMRIFVMHDAFLILSWTKPCRNTQYAQSSTLLPYISLTILDLLVYRLQWQSRLRPKIDTWFHYLYYFISWSPPVKIKFSSSVFISVITQEPLTLLHSECHKACRPYKTSSDQRLLLN